MVMASGGFFTTLSLGLLNLLLTSSFDLTYVYAIFCYEKVFVSTFSGGFASYVVAKRYYGRV
jgi:hypothetical protein